MQLFCFLKFNGYPNTLWTVCDFYHSLHVFLDIVASCVGHCTCVFSPCLRRTMNHRHLEKREKKSAYQVSMYLFTFPGWPGNEASSLPTELCPPPPIRQLYIINGGLETNPFHTASMHSETNYVLIVQGLTRVSLRCRCCCLTSTGFTKHFIHVRIHVSATCACMKMEVGRMRGEWRRWGWRKVRGKMWSW